MEEKSTEEYRDFLRNYLLLKEQVIREPDNFESFRHLIHKYGEEIPLSEMLELMDLADQRYGESSPEKLTELVEARYEKAADYLAKHPDDKDSTQKELQEEQETLLEEIAALKTPLTEVQEDLKKLRDIRYWVRKATPGTEESKEPPKKQPIKEVLQDKADEKKAQRTAPVQTKHKQQDMEL